MPGFFYYFLLYLHTKIKQKVLILYLYSLFYITDQGEIFLRENALSLVNSSIVHVVAMATDTGVPPRQVIA